MSRGKVRRSWRPISAAVGFGVIVATMAGSSRDAAAGPPIVVGPSCSLQNAAYSADYDVSVGGCTAGTPGHDLITLPAGTFNLGSAVEIWDDVTIQGAGMGNTIIISSSVADPSADTWLTTANCGWVQSALYINNWDVPVVFRDLTLQGVSGVFNQGICHAAGPLTLINARVTGFQNRAIFAANYSTVAMSLHLDHSLVDNNHTAGSGAGVYFYQTFDMSDLTVDGMNSTIHDLSITHSTLSGNFAEGFAGALYVGQDVDATALSTNIISASTFSGNSCIGNGGAIYQQNDTNGTYLEIFTSTIASNHATNFGGGIYKTTSQSDLEIFEDIVNNNTADSDHQQDNLAIGDTVTNNRTSCADTLMYLHGSGWTSTTLPGEGTNCNYATADAKLGALVGKGGLNNLPVRPLLLTGSPASNPSIDLGGIFDLSQPTDERDYGKPVDGDGNGLSLPDRGAFEYIPLQLETESLTVAAKSSDTHSVLTDSRDSGGQGTNLQSNAANDFVTYQTPTVATGTYAVTVRIKKGSNAGKFQLSKADTLTGAYTNVGAAQDTYGSSDGWVELSLGSLTVSTAGQKFFKLLVTGKNASSTGFQLFPDFIMLKK